MVSKRILLYYPPNKRSVASETICKTVKEAGHELFVLTFTERGEFHEAVEEMGIKTYSYVVPRHPSWKYFFKHARFLVKFCKQHKIDVVWSHLQEANFIAVTAQRFLKAKVYAFRHHDESAFYAEFGKKFGMVRNKKEVFIDRFINRFAKKIVVLSIYVLRTMKKYEHANEKKIIICPLIYDFNIFPSPDPAVVNKIKQKMDCKLLLIMISRMIGTKQHMPALEILKKLTDEGLSIKMIIMDDGPLRPKLESFIKDNNLTDKVLMPGFRSDLINYMAASDLLVHPSLTEASNNVVKEMAWHKKAVSVCKRVGDFDDYIKEGVNGYVLDRNNLKESVEKAIRNAYEHPDILKQFGENIKRDVLQLFSDSPQNRQRFLQLI